MSNAFHPSRWLLWAGADRQLPAGVTAGLAFVSRFRPVATMDTTLRETYSRRQRGG